MLLMIFYYNKVSEVKQSHYIRSYKRIWALSKNWRKIDHQHLLPSLVSMTGKKEKV